MRLKAAKIFFAFLGLALAGCGGRLEDEPEDPLREMMCKGVEKPLGHQQVELGAGARTSQLSFSDIRENINSSCMSCHQAPARSGGFSYIDSYQGEVRSIGGKTEFFPGFLEAAEAMEKFINHSDPKQRMPPEDRRSRNPEAFDRLGRNLAAWIQAGKPNGKFGTNGQVDQGPQVPRKPRYRTSELGDCIPEKEVVGFDYSKDRFFEKTQKLPTELSETDLFTLDSLELARKGTLSYNVEYPLWSDNNSKGRYIHVPMKLEGRKLIKQSVAKRFGKNEFEFPENTRLYKSFFKKVLMPNGKHRFRRIETRIIVVRKPWSKSLYGSYKWDDSEQVATLVETPYRDGSSFKDTVFPVVIDEAKNLTKDYPIPGRTRCIECHMGSESQSFIIGFLPLQINRRRLGEAGRLAATNVSEQTQLKRFIDYGLVSIEAGDRWPTLEESGTQPARNEHELRASGYMQGNCANCHNPKGLAFTEENKITLDLRAGNIFGFNTQQRSTEIRARLLIHQNGDLDQSQIWRKVFDPPQQQGLFSQMPMNVAATPDCDGLRKIGKWISSFTSLEAAEAFEPNCKKENELNWIDQDFTSLPDDFYIPRRADWNDPATGMPVKFKQVQLSQAMKDLLSAKVAVGYWSKKAECKFPDRELAAEQQRPWMLRDGRPKRPFGEVYETIPGTWFYRTTCMKCHGDKADGNSSLAKGILTWSGGKVRVANLATGLFGKNGANLKTFDTADGNLAPQYLFWMAMEGTQVQFPPELSGFLGKHGAQMLFQLREKCLAQISLTKNSNPNFIDHELFNKTCFAGNLYPGHPDLKFDPQTLAPVYPEKVEAWLDQASFNLGYSIFYFLKDFTSGVKHPGNDQCEISFAKEKAQGESQ